MVFLANMEFKKYIGKVASMVFGLALTFFNPALVQADDLQPGTPKLDTAPTTTAPKTSVLKGSVQHQVKSGKSKFKGQKGKVDYSGKSLSGNAAKGGLQGGTQSDQLASVGIIGVKFVMTAGRPPVINRVFGYTPAADVGMQIEDIIVAVDGIPTYGLTKEEVYDMIIGSPGSDVTLTIKRSGDYKVMSMKRMDINDLKDPIVRRDYLMSM